MFNKKDTESVMTKQINVLFVDDDMFTQAINSKFFKKLGCKFNSVFNGKEAFDFLLSNKENIDIVFMDTQMPVMNGLEASKTITTAIKEGKIKDTPIIIITADEVSDLDKKKAIEVGAKDNISKPLNREQINSILKKYVPNYFSAKEYKHTKYILPKRTSPDFMDINAFNSYKEVTGDKCSEILNKTIIFAQKSIQEIEKNITNKNYGEIMQITHKLKSSTGQIGAKKFSQVIADIEAILKTKDIIKLNNKLKEAKNEFKNIEAFTKKFIKNNS